MRASSSSWIRTMLRSRRRLWMISAISLKSDLHLQENSEVAAWGRAQVMCRTCCRCAPDQAPMRTINRRGCQPLCPRADDPGVGKRAGDLAHHLAAGAIAIGQVIAEGRERKHAPRARGEKRPFNPVRSSAWLRERWRRNRESEQFAGDPPPTLFVRFWSERNVGPRANVEKCQEQT